MHAIIDNKSGEVVNCAKEIIIEDHCWIGTRSIILKNVQLNKGCVIAAGSIVTSDVPCYSIVGGTPARVIKKDISWFRELPQKLNTERRNDVAEAFDDDRYVQTGFWLEVPEYIFRDDIKKCRVICKNNNIFGSKQIEIQPKSDV